MGVSMSRSISAESRSRAFLQPPRTTTPTTFFPPPPPPQRSTPATTMTLSANRVIAFHSSTKWKAYMESSNKLIVVDFTAAWCGPCKMMEPIFNELASKFGDVDFVKIDVDELIEASMEYGVQVLPTILLMKKGQVADRVVGVNKEELHKKIELHRLNNNYNNYSTTN